MIPPTHDDVHPPSGPLFIRNFLEMVDEYAGISEIVERYTARSTRSGDTMNRWSDKCTVLRDTRGIEAAGLNGKCP